MDYSEFFQQGIVQALMLIILVPLFLLALYLASVYVRWARRRNAPAPAEAVRSDALAQLRQASTLSDDDLPDLDLLAPAPPARPQDGMVTLASGNLARATTALAVLRDERDGRLMVQIDGKAYRSLADAPEAKREFTRLMKELSAVIMQADDNPPTESAQAPTPSVADIMRPSAPKPPAPPAPPKPAKETPTLDLPKAPKEASVPGDLPSYRFDDNPAIITKGRVGVKVDFVPPPDVDIPTAIEQFLQYKLHQTGMFPNRQIHVLAALGGGVRIRVDETYYEFVDDVAEDDVRAFIKAAIAEWQDRQG
jgi:hypothetical protein